MHERRIALTLTPLSEEGSALKVLGALRAEAPSSVLPRLISLLARWSGEPISIVLSAGAAPGGWCDRWVDALSSADPSDFEVRFESLPDEAAPERP